MKQVQTEEHVKPFTKDEVARIIQALETNQFCAEGNHAFKHSHYASLVKGNMAGLGGAIARWEKFRFNPPPSRQQLEALAVVVQVEGDRLIQMLPPAGVGMKMEPIRLYGACYAESPCHKIEWQFKTTTGCDRHKLALLSECPNCGARFKAPALWVDGWCHRCFLSFGEMTEYQRIC